VSESRAKHPSPAVDPALDARPNRSGSTTTTRLNASP
jgi:hypothetical protein